MSSTATSFAPLATSTGQPVKLAMQRLWLTGQVLPAGARLTVQHVFRTEEDKPLEVRVTGPIQDSDGGTVLEVREFFTLTPYKHSGY